MAEPREMKIRDSRRDDPARFLRELRALRDHAGLGYVELAARAHYPCDAIKAAESGPSLPDLPVLSAYVRGCGGTTAEWEERWRAVTGCAASPVLTTRAAGCSAAADAGARVGAASCAADGHDPDRVMAALNRVAGGMAAAASSSTTSSTSAGGAGSVMASPALSDAALARAAASDAAATRAAPSDDGMSDAVNAALSGTAAFDDAIFEALAIAPVGPAAPAVPDQAPAREPSVWDPAPAPRPAAMDRVPPARRADYPAPTAVAGGAAPPATLTRPASRRALACRQPRQARQEVPGARACRA